LFALLPLALVGGGYSYVTGGRIMSTDNAYVQADIVGVATDVSGIVRSVEVHENQAVAAGDVLFKLDDLPMRLALAQAEAQTGIVRNDLNALRASYRDMEAQIRQSEADVAYYQTEFERQQTLSKSNFASRSSFDQARHQLMSAQQELASLQQQLAGIAANLNDAPDEPVERHPRFQAAVAARDEAARQLAHTVVRAPMDGIVTNVPSLQVGQYLAAATPAFSIVSTNHVWVEASPKETELTYVRPGQHVTVSVDSYPSVVWQGEVDSISPASGSSFSLLPAQNTTGNWVKVVQRIPMRVRLQTSPEKPPLRVGMSVEAEVDTGHARGLPSFLTGLLSLSNKSDA
jgi:membrane fusion protein (multidrug efflux system)